MLQFLSDEDFDGRIVAGLLRRRPDLNIVRVQDVLSLGVNDLDILLWAAEDQRTLLTHDIRTMPRHFGTRMHAGLSSAGVIIVQQSINIGPAIDGILTFEATTSQDEMINRLVFL